MSAEKGEKVTELGPREDVLTEIVDGLKNTNNFGDFSSIALIRILQALVTLMWWVYMLKIALFLYSRND